MQQSTRQVGCTTAPLQNSETLDGHAYSQHNVQSANQPTGSCNTGQGRGISWKRGRTYPNM
eukprot:2963112-Pyramimonas_sp.AAC.2